MKKGFLISALFLISSGCFAGMTTNVSVVDIGVHDQQQYINFKFSPSLQQNYANSSQNTNPDDVTCVNKDYASISYNNGSHEKLYAMLLSAFSMNKKISIQYSDTECGLWGGQLLVEKIWITNN